MSCTDTASMTSIAELLLTLSFHLKQMLLQQQKAEYDLLVASIQGMYKYTLFPAHCTTLHWLFVAQHSPSVAATCSDLSMIRQQVQSYSPVVCLLQTPIAGDAAAFSISGIGSNCVKGEAHRCASVSFPCFAPEAHLASDASYCLSGFKTTGIKSKP